MEKASVVFFGYSNDAIELSRSGLIAYGHTISANEQDFHDSYRLFQSIVMGKIACDVMVLNSDLLDECGRQRVANTIFSLYNDYDLANNYGRRITLIGHPKAVDILNIPIIINEI